MLEPFEAEHGLRQRLAAAAHLLGTSGTVTTVAGVHLGLPRYERNQVDGCWLDIAEARAVTAGLLGRPTRSGWRSPASARSAPTSCWPAAPSSRRCCRPGRAERLRVADRGLREGILATLMAEDGVYRSERRGGYWRR